MDARLSSREGRHPRRLFTALRAEASLFAGSATAALLYTVGKEWLTDLSDPLRAMGLFIWIFTMILWCALNVVRHADHLAEKLGEPFGTLILTFAVVSIEVSLMASIMVFGADAPTLARDTMMAVLMIVLNGMVGVALLIGGIRHGEQEFNLQGARAFLSVLVPLATMALILPRSTISTPEPTLSPMQGALFAAITIALYATFLGIQTRRHRGFFQQPNAGDADAPHPVAENHSHRSEGRASRSTTFHGLLLLLTMLPAVLLSEKLATLVDYGVETLHAPAALGGVLIATLVLTPEGISALHAAIANRLQRAVNICLGSVLSTIGLTVPAVLIIGLVTGEDVVLGIDDNSLVLLVLTLFVSALTFGGPRTNMLQGAVHLVIFFVYLVLIFNP